MVVAVRAGRTLLDPHDAYVLVWDFNCPTLFDCHAAGDGATDEEPVIEGFANVM